MKTSIFLLILLALAISNLAQAETKTPVTYSTDKMKISGTARQSTAVSAIVFYTPLFNFDKKLSAKDCEFQEDHWSPNGPDRNVVIKTTVQNNGQYVLEIPAEGQRAKCPYVLDSIYLNYEDGDVTQTLSLLSERNISKQNESLSDIGETFEVKDFSSLKELFCEFKSEFSTGFCYSIDDSIDLQYGIANKGVNYTLDIKDISLKPPRQY
jgi:hypothetical protein